MVTKPVPNAERLRRKRVFESLLKKGYAPPTKSSPMGSATSQAALKLGIGRSTMDSWLRRELNDKLAKKKHYYPDFSLFEHPALPEVKKIKSSYDELDFGAVISTLRRGPVTFQSLSEKFGLTLEETHLAVQTLQSQHINVHVHGDQVSVPRTPPPGLYGQVFEYVSRPDNTFLFGAHGDSHYGSKYCREDVMESLYDSYAEAKVDRVFHTGNWIDGEIRFNRYDLSIHGMDAQCRYLAKKYPERDGIVTYAVAGDDHEGWYAQREGVDIGAHAERLFRDIGREDWVNLGYMEAHIKLVNANTGAFCMMAVVHPGGGSSYADSYSVQKIIESLEGGEKPAVWLGGHYHKMIAGEYRNVWWALTGCGKGQDTFGRKNKLRYTLGGLLIQLRQDPDTGAIVGFRPEMLRFFDKGYYWQRNQRWSHAEEVMLPDVKRSPR